jgi:hypothetical protein
MYMSSTSSHGDAVHAAGQSLPSLNVSCRLDQWHKLNVTNGSSLLLPTVAANCSMHHVVPEANAAAATILYAV